jgi:dihydroxyacetone kinase-like predicted kinase
MLTLDFYLINIYKRRLVMLEYKFDTQLLIEGEGLSEDEINEYITKNIEGDCLLAVGDDELIKIHFHTNTPWKVLEYCASLGEIHDIVIENMQRQTDGLQG